MGKLRALLLVPLFLLPTLRAEIVTEDPATLTKDAYKMAMTHFGFSADTLGHEKRFFTPDLYAALLKKANQPVAKGDATDIEGDVLLDSQDIPDKFEVGTASIDGTKAEVPVNLSWGSEKRRYVVHLVQVAGAWKIADVDYGKDGKLTDLLK